MNKIICVMVILFNISYFNIGKAEEIDWMVSHISGDAFIKKPGYQKKQLELYDYFAAGDLIATAANGTVGLSRNNEAMVISANSILELPKNNNSSQITLVFQKLGTIIFSAKKRNRKHFEVRTPYSAAIVKGTTFAISVNQYNSQLQVFEGAVLLNGKGRKESYIIKAGNKSLTPRNISKKILIQKIKRSSAINPHLGSDVSRLILNYAGKVEIGNIRKNDFSAKPQNIKIKSKSTIGTVNRGNNKNKHKTNKSKYIPEAKPNRSNNTVNSSSNASKAKEKAKSSSNASKAKEKTNSSANASKAKEKANSSAAASKAKEKTNASAAASKAKEKANASAAASKAKEKANASAAASKAKEKANASAAASKAKEKANASAAASKAKEKANASANSNNGNGKGKK